MRLFDLILISQSPDSLPSGDKSTGSIFLDGVKAVNDYGTAAFAVIAIAGVAYIFRELGRSNDKRIDDITRLNKEHLETIQKIIPLMEKQLASNNAVTDALERSVGADRALNDDVRSLRDSVQNLITRVETLERSIDRSSSR